MESEQSLQDNPNITLVYHHDDAPIMIKLKENFTGANSYDNLSLKDYSVNQKTLPEDIKESFLAILITKQLINFYEESTDFQQFIKKYSEKNQCLFILAEPVEIKPELKALIKYIFPKNLKPITLWESDLDAMNEVTTDLQNACKKKKRIINGEFIASLASRFTKPSKKVSFLRRYHFLVISILSVFILLYTIYFRSVSSFSANSINTITTIIGFAWMVIVYANFIKKGSLLKDKSGFMFSKYKALLYNLKFLRISNVIFFAASCFFIWQLTCYRVVDIKVTFKDELVLMNDLDSGVDDEKVKILSQGNNKIRLGLGEHRLYYYSENNMDTEGFLKIKLEFFDLKNSYTIEKQ